MNIEQQQRARTANPDARPQPRALTLADAVDFYLSAHASASMRKLGGRTIREASLGRVKVYRLTTKAIRDWCEGRLDKVRATTVREDLKLIRRAVETARRELGVTLDTNPAVAVEVDDRERRLSSGELTALLDAVGDNPHIRALITLAFETELPLGALMSLQWRDVQLGLEVAYIRKTSTGPIHRSVPLSGPALETLRALDRSHRRVFPIAADRFRWAWNAACRRAGVKGVRFFEPRHVLRRQ